MAASISHALAFIMKLKHCVFGPRLFRIFPLGGGSPGREFDSNNLEFFCDTFIRTLSYAISFSAYSSPLLAYYAYRKSMTTAGHLVYMSKFLVTLTSTVALAYILRGIGRFSNPDYRRFISILLVAKEKPEERQLLQSYDFEFFAWPVDFRWDQSSLKKPTSKPIVKENRNLSFLQNIMRLPMNIIEYVVAHSFARPMIFPGSVKLLQSAMFQPLTTGRAMLIEKNGHRAKLLTQDQIEIDTMFLDRRNTEGNGRTLVINSEGNAGYYEVGCMVTPRNAGFSVLGWNHPGFAGSTGIPSPQTEHGAIEAVVMYAVTKLGFTLDNIILFAWSIGGYSTSYAAMTFPDIKAVIIDATFDDVMPLAEAKMPGAISGIVAGVIENYFPLNVAQNLVRYPGPIKLVRRLQDEIIATQAYNPATNRGNFLLIQLLTYRYPHVMTEKGLQAVKIFLSAQDTFSQVRVKTSMDYDEGFCEATVRSYTDGQWPTFPSEMGLEWAAEIRRQVAVFLAIKYMSHFDATHCTPLPSSYFQLPWNHE